jgi:hypothetical protein
VASAAEQNRRARGSASEESGQAIVLLLGLTAAVLTGVLVLAAFGQALGARGSYQRAADLAAVSGAAAMRADYARLFEPARLASGAPNPRHLSRARYLARARAGAVRGARLNGVALRRSGVTFPDRRSFAPLRVRVLLRGSPRVRVPARRSSHARLRVRAAATAALVPQAGGASAYPQTASGGGYSGPLAYRQGKPFHPM